MLGVSCRWLPLCAAYRFLHTRVRDPTARRFSHQMNAYLPRGKDWIKQQAYQHLNRQARGA